MRITVGGNASEPYVALRLDASLRDYYNSGGNELVPDEGYLQRGFYPDASYARWREQFVTTGLSYSQCGGASLPQPGAICFPNYWLGAQFGLEARHSAVNPTTTSDGPYFPDYLDGNWQLALGAWGPGDILWNLAGQVEVPLSRWPVAWRFRRYTGRRPDDSAWATSTAYRAGTIIKPATNNPSGYLFQAMFAASTTVNAVDEPNWSSAVIGSHLAEVNTPINTRPQIWRCIGTELNTDSGAAGLYEPLITQAPTMGIVDLSSPNVVGTSLTLTPEEASFERLKVIKSGGSAASTILMPKGAGDGWLKFFWNASGAEFAVQMIGGGPSVLVSATPNPSGAYIASDGSACLKAT